MLDRKDLLRRIRKWMAEGKKAEGKIQPLTAIRLLHSNAESGERPIESWDVDETTHPEELVNELLSTADGDSDSHKGDGTQRYAFIAHFGDAGAWTATFKFNIYKAPDAGEEGAEMSTDAGTQKGLLVTAHKHIEQTLRISVGSSETQHRFLIRQLEMKDARIEKLESERDAVWEAQQDLMDRTHQRARDDRKQAFWEQKKEEITSILFPMLPMLFAIVFRKKVPGDNSVAPEMVALKEFLKTFKEDQLKALFDGSPQEGVAPIFSPQQAMFMRMAIQQAVESEDKSEDDVRKRMIDPPAHDKMRKSLFEEEDEAPSAKIPKDSDPKDEA